MRLSSRLDKIEDYTVEIDQSGGRKVRTILKFSVFLYGRVEKKTCILLSSVGSSRV